MVNEWQNRLLSEKNYPYLMTDVLYIKVREENRVLSKSCHIAIGITKDGDREIIGFMIQTFSTMNLCESLLSEERHQESLRYCS
ncbi:hypothetical protein EfmJHP38_20840 [Enterococcus faecium]|nr:hypothetical protein EfmJHP38_20840 [Enterococcus faecium]